MGKNGMAPGIGGAGYVGGFLTDCAATNDAL